MYRIVPNLVSVYRKLPFKPLKGVLRKAFNNYLQYNRGKTVICSIDGIRYELDLNELIDSEIYHNGSFEPDTATAINNLCRRGMTVLDIGANIGCHTFLFAKMVGVKGKVIAFEPTSYAFEKLKRNLQLNNFNNVIIEKIALTNENKDDQEISFCSSWPLDYENRSGIHPVHHGRVGGVDIVSFVRLDDYMKKKAVKQIDIIKLDVDGYELRVIEGAIETLRLHRPIIIAELWAYTHEEIGDSVFDLVLLFSDLGYGFYSIKDMSMLSENLVNERLRRGGGFNSIILRAV